MALAWAQIRPLLGITLGKSRPPVHLCVSKAQNTSVWPRVSLLKQEVHKLREREKGVLASLGLVFLWN